MASSRFWNDITIEPKRSFRFFATFSGNDTGIESYAIKTVKKPSFQISETMHQYVAHTFYYPGRITWQPVDITFVDPVVLDHSSIITNMLYQAGYRKPGNEEIARRSFSKENFNNALGQIRISQVDAEGAIIDEWSLINCFFTNVDYGQLDYNSEELVVLSTTIRYDFASFDNLGGAPTSLLNSNAG